MREDSALRSASICRVEATFGSCETPVKSKTVKRKIEYSNRHSLVLILIYRVKDFLVELKSGLDKQRMAILIGRVGISMLQLKSQHPNSFNQREMIKFEMIKNDSSLKSFIKLLDILMDKDSEKSSIFPELVASCSPMPNFTKKQLEMGDSSVYGTQYFQRGSSVGLDFSYTPNKRHGHNREFKSTANQRKRKELIGNFELKSTNPKNNTDLKNKKRNMMDSDGDSEDSSNGAFRDIKKKIDFESIPSQKDIGGLQDQASIHEEESSSRVLLKEDSIEDNQQYQETHRKGYSSGSHYIGGDYRKVGVKGISKEQRRINHLDSTQNDISVDNLLERK